MLQPVVVVVVVVDATATSGGCYVLLVIEDDVVAAVVVMVVSVEGPQGAVPGGDIASGLLCYCRLCQAHAGGVAASTVRVRQ